MDYPGHIVKVGETDAAVVKALVAGLAARGYASTSPPGVFDKALKSLVMTYQSQNANATAQPLKPDGEVGPLTWGAIFAAAPVSTPALGLSGAALGVAISQIGVLEIPAGSNRGPQVDDYQRTAGLALPTKGQGFSWCMAFVYWCFSHAAGTAPNPFPKTAGCIDAWNKVKAGSPKRIITRAQAIADPTIVRAGLVFILDHGGGAGHTGFVRQSTGGALRTVEGNTNPVGSPNGLGVFELNRRNVMDPTLKGFLDFS